eukprot:1540733-Alexandrium_andersonii.AAC.1
MMRHQHKPGERLPPGPPAEECLRRARRSVSSSDSTYARTTPYDAPLQEPWGSVFRTPRGRTVQSSNTSSKSGCLRSE